MGNIEMTDEKRKFEFKLTPAAAAYREKLMLRTRDDLPPGLCELPAFDFRAPAREAAPEIQRGLVKGMFQLVASAIVEYWDTNQSQLQFVSSIRYSVARGEFEFDFACPFPVLTELIQKNIKDARRAAGRIKNLSIRYKMRVPDNLRVPIVFVYEPTNKALLVTNENHFSNPQQFLDPELCRTTSGFLNFIGTFLLLENITDGAVLVEETLAQGNIVMNRGLDEWMRWLYCLVDKNIVYQQKRILVDPEAPETFFFLHPMDFDLGSQVGP